MARSLSTQEVNQLALLGAQARLTSLRAEIGSLLRAFPQLGRGTARATVSRGATRAPRARRRSRKRTMTAEQRKAVSERMKRYWAARRKEKGK
jgi:hypothetical protein